MLFYRVNDVWEKIRSTLTARTIATSFVHSKLDYCNSLYYKLPHVQIGRLQVIQNALARAVTNTPKFALITPILKTLHWLKIRQRMEYNILSLTYTALQQREPRYLLNKLYLRPPGSTRSSSLVTLQVPSVKLQTGKRSFYTQPSHLEFIPKLPASTCSLPSVRFITISTISKYLPSAAQDTPISSFFSTIIVLTRPQPYTDLDLRTMTNTTAS